VSGESIREVGSGIIGASIWPESIGTLTKIYFPYWFQDHAKGFLYYPVVYGWDAKWPLFPFGFWDVHPSDRRWFKGLGLECFSETFQVPL